MYNDGKIQNVKSISLRNLYLNTPLPELDEPKGPSEGNVRRHSIIEPAIESHESHLELMELNNRKLLDTFFSLHLIGKSKREELLYISEVRKCNMNPNFGEISLPYIPNLPGRTHRIILKIWCRQSLQHPTDSDSDWVLLSTNKIDLRKLESYGVDGDIPEDFFKPNSILINLKGNLYTLPQSLKHSPEVLRSMHKLQNEHRRVKSEKLPKSYSFDTLRSISNLSRSLQELTASKYKLTHLILKNISVLHDTSNIANITMSLKKLEESIKVLDKSIKSQKSKNDTLSSEILNSRIRIDQIRTLTNEKLNSIVEMGLTQSELTQARVDPIKESLVTSIYPKILDQLKNLTKVVQQVFTIVNVDNSVRFSILGIRFPSSIEELLETCYYEQPNSNDSDHHQQNIQEINSGLSYIVQLMNALADITNANLKYKMINNGSYSKIIDPIFAEKLTATSNFFSARKQNGGNPEEHNNSAISYPLHYDPSVTERLSVDPDISSSGRNFILKNVPFEKGLSMLNKNMIILINCVTEIYSEFKSEIDSESHQTGQKFNITSSIPIDCLDNFLWNLQYLILYLTASSS